MKNAFDLVNFCELETHCFDDDGVVAVDGGLAAVAAVVGDLEIGGHFEAAADVTCDEAEWPHMAEACQVDLGLH